MHIRVFECVSERACARECNRNMLSLLFAFLVSGWRLLGHRVRLGGRSQRERPLEADRRSDRALRLIDAQHVPMCNINSAFVVTRFVSFLSQRYLAVRATTLPSLTAVSHN